MPKLYSVDFKLSVINFYNSDLFTIQNTLAIFNISKATLYNWINIHNNGLSFNNSNFRKPYKSNITFQIHQYIIVYVTKRIHFSTKNLRKCIKRIFNVCVCKSSIYYVLKINNITNKQISSKILPSKQNNKSLISDLLKTVSVHDSENIVSIDESSFNLHMKPSYGWSKKGISISKSIKNPNRKTKTLTLAITKNKIIGYNLVNCSSNSLNFESFLKHDVFPHITNSLLLMDNARIHHSKNIVDLVNSTSNKILYNVPYNPETNPIEFVFSIIKSFVKNKEPSSELDLNKYILKSFSSVTPTKLKSIFRHSLNI